MIVPMRFLCCVAAAMLTCSYVASAASFRAGIAKAEITPPAGEQMWGYENRTKPATGTLDALYARVLVIEANNRRLGLIALDLGRAFGAASLDEAVEGEIAFYNNPKYMPRLRSTRASAVWMCVCEPRTALTRPSR